MPTPIARVSLKEKYREAAEQYMLRLRQEHFMESTSQATQREITLESLALVKPHRRDVHVFNELLVQYPVPHRARLGQVVPDNMVVLHPGSIVAEGSYDLPDQPAPPFWVLEYVSESNPIKDYVDNLDKYEYDLKVRYYLLFRPESQEITLYHLKGKKYVRVKPNARGRHAISQLDLQVGLHAGWMRYWFRGDLLPLPAELQQELAQERQARMAAEQEVVRLRAELEQLKRGRAKRAE